MKRTKKFNKEWAEAIALLPVNQQQSLIAAIRTYQNEGIEPQGLHPIAQAVFIVIKPTIDARARRCAYQKERRKRLKPSVPKSTKPKATASPVTAEPPKKEEKPINEILTDTIPGKQPPRPLSSSNRFLRQVEKARQSRHGTR